MDVLQHYSMSDYFLVAVAKFFIDVISRRANQAEAEEMGTNLTQPVTDNENKYILCTYEVNGPIRI